MSTPGIRTQHCNHNQGLTRRRIAEKLLELAQLLADEEDSANWNVAVSLAVLAGIAASDAACCAALGRRSRGENHHDAERLLAEITVGGLNSLALCTEMKLQLNQCDAPAASLPPAYICRHSLRIFALDTYSNRPKLETTAECVVPQASQLS